jgi:hypothetical protein
MEFLQEPWFWVLVTAASEIIGMSKLKSNSIVELALRAVFSLKPRNIKE